MRNGRLRWVRFILANDAVGLHASIITFEANGVTERHDVI